MRTNRRRVAIGIAATAAIVTLRGGSSRRCLLRRDRPDRRAGPGGTGRGTGTAGAPGRTRAARRARAKGDQGEPGASAEPATLGIPDASTADPGLSGGLLISSGTCPVGTSQWDTIYVGRNSVLGSPGDVDMRAMTLCKIF